MGSRNRGVLKDCLMGLGSVSNYVIQNTINSSNISRSSSVIFNGGF